MTDQYSDLVDAQLALHQLRKTRQRPDENVQNYAERLIVLYDYAYPGDNITVDHIQKQLVETFTDGVKDNAIARKFIREKPITLEKALQITGSYPRTTKS